MTSKIDRINKRAEKSALATEATILKDRKAEEDRAIPDWWFFLNTEEGRDQTLAHAMYPHMVESLCGISLDRLGAEYAEPEFLEDEEKCSICAPKEKAARFLFFRLRGVAENGDAVVFVSKKRDRIAEVRSCWRIDGVKVTKLASVFRKVKTRTISPNDEEYTDVTDIVTATGVAARTAHEANRAYCISIGDLSQPSWDAAPDWQKTSAYNGVEGVMKGNTPEQSHESWLEEKRRTGWVYGVMKDPDAKTHPCMVPYADLLPAQRVKDEIYVGVVRVVLGALGALEAK